MTGLLTSDELHPSPLACLAKAKSDAGDTVKPGPRQMVWQADPTLVLGLGHPCDEARRQCDDDADRLPGQVSVDPVGDAPPASNRSRIGWDTPCARSPGENAGQERPGLRQ